MYSIIHPIIAGAALLVTGALSAQDVTASKEADLRQKIAESRKALEEARVEGLSALEINGKVLSPDQIRREAIYLVGAKQIEAKIAEFFIADQIKQAIEEGREAADFEVSDEEVIKDIEGAVAEFQKTNPGVSFWDAVRAQFGMDKDSFLFQRKQTKLFDEVFFPGPAKNWPAITREAIMASAAGGNGKQFWENLEKASVDENGTPRPLPDFWMHLCRGWVQKQLKKWSDIRYPSDGLPPEICLRVNDLDWRTDEAFEDVRPGLFSQDLERAMTEVAVRETLRQELEKHTSYLSDEEFRKEFDDYRQEYDSTPFTTEVIAVAFKGYPSLEAYRQRWRLMRSFEKMIEAEINDDNLTAHAEKFKAFFSDGQTNIDVVQFLARDPQTGAWRPNGIEGARARAEAAMKQIENGANFDDVLAQQGEYYANDKEKGRLGSRSLNQLRQAMRENEFADLLLGYSVGSYLFYEAEVGKVVGPLRGPEGYYIARVNSRTPARRPVNVQDERSRELVKQDYSAYRFLQWANEVLAKSSVR